MKIEFTHHVFYEPNLYGLQKDSELFFCKKGYINLMIPSHAGDMTEICGCEEIVQDELLKFNECPLKPSKIPKLKSLTLLIPESLWQEWRL